MSGDYQLTMESEDGSARASVGFDARNLSYFVELRSEIGDLTERVYRHAVPAARIQLASGSFGQIVSRAIEEYDAHGSKGKA